MIYKLIRVDTAETSKPKLDLNVGKHVIGRGKFLHNDDEDKRVSRNHAELDVTDDSITLRSLHKNPCFYIKKDTSDTEIISQDSTVSLQNGDRFGLLPENFWYEVIYLNTDVVNGNNGLSNNCELSNENGNQTEEEDTTASPETTDAIQGEDQQLTQEYTNPVSSDDPVTPNKRNHESGDSSPIDTKKIKAEPDTPDAQAGPSNDQAESDDSKDQKPNIAPTPPRERCIYGANCYRRNPQHKAQFSHPADSDWGTGERGLCPFGANCRRRDPRHWTTHEHPAGTRPPDPAGRRPGMQIVERNGNIFYINAHSVNFYDDRFQVEDSDGDSVDYDYEF